MRERTPLLALVLPLLLAGAPAGDDGTFEKGPAWPVEATRADTVLQEAERSVGDPDAGRRLFSQLGCNGCHMVDDVGGAVGPDLTEVGGRPSRDPDRWPTTEAYIRSSIREPGAYIVSGYTDMMPPPEVLGVDEEGIEDLVAYLLGLKGENEQ